MQDPESTKVATETEIQNEEESKKASLFGIPLPVWDSISKSGSSFLVAAVGLAGVIGGALITGVSEVGGQHLQSRAQFQLERQKFEFELIREALEAQPTPQITDQEELTDDEVTDEVISFAQDISLTDQETDDDDFNGDDEDRQRAAKELLFYTDIGIIQSLDVRKVREWATREEGAELPRLQSSTSSSPNSTNLHCFSAVVSVSVYSRPSFKAEIIGDFEIGDIAYATGNPITSYWYPDGTSDGNSFVKVALYNGVAGWIPRFQQGSESPAILDLQDCPDSGSGALGMPLRSSDERACFYVLESTNIYRLPDFETPLDAGYIPGDIAYAAYPLTNVAIQNGPNAFVLVDFFDGDQGWVPRYSADLSTKILELYPPEDC